LDHVQGLGRKQNVGSFSVSLFKECWVNKVRGIIVYGEMLAELEQWCMRLNIPFDCSEVNI
jgi:hypothetical protein